MKKFFLKNRGNLVSIFEYQKQKDYIIIFFFQFILAC